MTDVNAIDYDVLVLGAGAGGLFSAMTAGKRQRRVLVLEKSNKVGKKILMSGGGRCNFTNYNIEANNYLSENPHFCKAALKRYTQWDFISMVEDHAIAYEERKHGQLFCLESAQDILTMLLKECEMAGAKIYTHSTIAKIVDLTKEKPEDSAEGRYKVVFHRGKKDKVAHTIVVNSIVVATGALSIPTLGGSSMGFDIAEQFSLPLVERRAGLVPFMFSDAFKSVCERLAGVSVSAEVSCNGVSFNENILFTHRGISGPAILQISNYWKPGDKISIDLLPDIDAVQWLLDAKKKQGKMQLHTLLSKKLGKSLVKELQMLFWQKLSESPLAEFSDKELILIAKIINNWSLKPSGTEGYRTAEVTIGGVDTSSISSKTMQCSNQPGLYFVGEVLDVTGHLGGYNFQWAWSSGYSAGFFA